MKQIVQLLLKIFLEPTSLWQSEGPPLVKSLWQALFPMAFATAAIPAIALFIGKAIIGDDLGPFGQWRLPIGPAILVAVMFYLLLIAGLLAMGFLIHSLGKVFKANVKMTFEQCVMTANVVCTPLFIGGLFLLYPDMTPLWFLSGLYGIYLMKNIGVTIHGVPATHGWQYAITLFVLYYILVVGLSHTAATLISDAFTPNVAEMLQSAGNLRSQFH